MAERGANDPDTSENRSPKAICPVQSGNWRGRREVLDHHVAKLAIFGAEYGTRPQVTNR